MAILRFRRVELRSRALGCLSGRFPGQKWEMREVAVPAWALSYLPAGGVEFSVEDRATYQQEFFGLRNKEQTIC